MITLINVIGIVIVLILTIFDIVLDDEFESKSKTKVRQIFELIILAILIIFNLVEAM